MKRKRTVYLENLGCNKNTVDSEIILSLLREKGYRRTESIEEASFIIVNTCAFIDDAKQQTIDAILELSRYRRNGRKLIVAGCFSQLYSREIESELPEVDAIVGNGDLSCVVEAVERVEGVRDYPKSRVIPQTFREYTGRTELLTPPGYAYVKISDGCSRPCSFCLIPLIKGGLRSRRFEDILRDVGGLEGRGVKEIILTSQDTLSFGTDLGMKGGLESLIVELLVHTSIPFIRLLYLRPARELLETLEVFQDARLVPYFDIPVQHASTRILTSMKREGDSSCYREVIDRIRERVPNAVLRSTVIVGFPGEDDEDFQKLLEFVKDVQFQHLGVFVYSPQRGTEAYRLKGRVRKAVGEMRRREIMSVQQGISRNLLHGEIGKVFDVLIEEPFHGEGESGLSGVVVDAEVDGENLSIGISRGISGGISIGRSLHFAPEVDGVFLVRSSDVLKPGIVVRAIVTGADDYDLHGIALPPNFRAYPRPAQDLQTGYQSQRHPQSSLSCRKSGMRL